MDDIKIKRHPVTFLDKIEDIGICIGRIAMRILGPILVSALYAILVF